MKPTETDGLARELENVLRSMAPASLEVPSPAAVLALADLAYLSELFGSPLDAWARGRAALAPAALLETIAASPTAHARLLASDLAFANQVLGDGADLEYAGFCGLRSAAFPLMVQGRMIHCVWVRNYLASPIAGDDLRLLAGWCGGSAAALAELAVPVLTRPQVEGLLGAARATRNALQAAVEQHLHAGEMIHQLAETEHTRSLGTLAGGIAHRFNNLLSVILGYASFVQNREPLSAESDAALHKICDAAQQGRRLTEEILAFAGSEVEQTTTCRVHEVLTSILSLLQSQAPSHVAVETALAAAQDGVLAPPSAVHQLVFNLLTNAFASLPDGGEIAITSANEAAGGDEDAGLRLAITCRGAPAAEEEPGGDRMAQAVAEGLGGALRVSHEHPGTIRFDLRLPVEAPSAAGGPAPLAPRRVVPSFIWVVDDDPVFREMCRQVLGDEGHQVTLLESGRDLQELWGASPVRPDALIIDFSMPEYNGLELCTWLRRHGSTKPVILVSGFSETQPDIRRALELRKTHFLRKPFSYREMLDIVTVALGETLIGAPPPA